MTKDTYNQGKIIANKQDESREFISLLATICADGTKLPLALIYKGKTGSLQDIWLDDIGDEDVYFIASPKGWSSNQFGLDYLKQVFDSHTRAKAGRSKRLLIVDGHSSHVNIAFLEGCDRRRICVLVLPLHST
jgi:hypothetical protein